MLKHVTAIATSLWHECDQYRSCRDLHDPASVSAARSLVLNRTARLERLTSPSPQPNCMGAPSVCLIHLGMGETTYLTFGNPSLKDLPCSLHHVLCLQDWAYGQRHARVTHSSSEAPLSDVQLWGCVEGATMSMQGPTHANPITPLRGRVQHAPNGRTLAPQTSQWACAVTAEQPTPLPPARDVGGCPWPQRPPRVPTVTYDCVNASSVASSAAGSKSPVTTQEPRGPLSRIRRSLPSCTFLSTAMMFLKSALVMPWAYVH